MVRGFETYLTGYPLGEFEGYALARTWYAPEMDRPGCVWTHTLVINQDDLGYFDNLWKLTQCFRRPDIQRSSWDVYSRPISLTCSDHNFQSLLPKDFSESFRPTIEKAVDALYGSPTSQAFLPIARISEQYEQFVIAIWSQQWRHLRQRFKFCTGAIANRRSPDEPFDFQLIPNSAVRDIQRQVSKSVVIDNTGSEESEPWVTLTVNDLLHGDPKFRRFIIQLGNEASGQRSDFVQLVQLYRATSERAPASAQELVTAIATLFPRPTEGQFIKRGLLGHIDAKVDLAWTTPLSLADALEAITTTSYFKAFELEALRLSDHVLTLLQDNPNAALEIVDSILKQDVTPIGRQYINEICEALLSLRAPEVMWHSDIIHSLLNYEPNLIAQPAFWQSATGHISRSRYDAARELLVSGTIKLSKVVAAMLNARTDEFVSDLMFDFSRGDIIVPLLEWTKDKPATAVMAISDRWKEIPAVTPKNAMAWLQQQSRPSLSSVVFLANTLDPFAWDVRDTGSQLWLKYIDEIKSEIDRCIRLQAMSFFLALGFNNIDRFAIKLVIKSFEVVYFAARDTELTEERWRWLKRLAPPVSYGRDWDKCERLRAAILAYFIRYAWPHQGFLECVRDPSLLKEIAEQALRDDGWFVKPSNYIRETAELVRRHKLKATKGQQRVLRQLF
jgi:hypothetical protein